MASRHGIAREGPAVSDAVHRTDTEMHLRYALLALLGEGEAHGLRAPEALQPPDRALLASHHRPGASEPQAHRVPPHESSEVPASGSRVAGWSWVLLAAN